MQEDAIYNRTLCNSMIQFCLNLYCSKGYFLFPHIYFIVNVKLNIE